MEIVPGQLPTELLHLAMGWRRLLRRRAVAEQNAWPIAPKTIWPHALGPSMK
jgi:hypothetical protein